MSPPSGRDARRSGRRYLPAAFATAGRCDAPPEQNMARLSAAAGAVGQ